MRTLACVALAGCTDSGLIAVGPQPNALAKWDENRELTSSSLIDNGSSISLLEDTTRFTTSFDGEYSHARIILPSNVPDRGPFNLDTGINLFNETVDPTMALGYNTNSHGRKLLADEHSLGWYIEADYNDGARRLMEVYTQYTSPDLSIVLRPLFFQIDRATHRLTNSVLVGNPLNVTDDLGNSSLELSPTVALFKGAYLASTSADWTLYTTAANGMVNLRSNGGGVNINSLPGSGDVDIGRGGGTTTIHGNPVLGTSSNTVQVNNQLSVTDGVSYVSVIASGGINYLQSGGSSTPGSSAELRFTDRAAQNTWAKFDETGDFISYKRLRLGDTGPSWSTGLGNPEGVVTAPVGSLYTRTDGGPGSTLYVKESGAGATGWTAK